jgi:hypothetical protein
MKDQHPTRSPRAVAFSLGTVTRSGALMLASMLTLSGCGNLTAGGFGEAHVVASGDAADFQAAASYALLAGPSRADHEGGEVDAEGEIELRFRLFLGRADGSELELTNGGMQVELDLGGDVEADVLRVPVPADGYTTFRVAFTEIEVEIAPGFVIDGQPVDGFIDIELEGPGLDVVRAVDLNVGEGAVVELLLDFNASIWVQLIDPATSTVGAADFAQAFSVVVR